MAVHDARPAPPPPGGLIASSLVRKFLKNNGFDSALKRLETALQKRGWPFEDLDTVHEAVGSDSLEQLVIKIDKDTKMPNGLKAVQSKASKEDKVARVNEDAHPCKWNSCREQYSTADVLFKHVSEKHVGRAVNGDRTLECLWHGCSYTAKSNKRDHVISHVQTHIEFKPFLCRYCGMKSRKSSDTKRHEASCDKGPAKSETTTSSLKRKLSAEPSIGPPQAKTCKRVKPATEPEQNGAKDMSNTSISENAPASDSNSSSTSSSDDTTSSDESDGQKTATPAKAARTKKIPNSTATPRHTPGNTKSERLEVTPVKKHVGARPTPLAQLSAHATPDSHVSNAYQSYDYADRAFNDLSVTRGKGFTKEKNKKKRGSYRGGAIDISGGKAFKFDD